MKMTTDQSIFAGKSKAHTQSDNGEEDESKAIKKMRKREIRVSSSAFSSMHLSSV